MNIRLKKLRKEKKLSQAELGKLLGVTVSAYGHYELGTSEPSVQSVIKLSKFYNVSTDYLLGVSDNRNYDFIESLFKNLNTSDKVYISNLIKRVSKLNEKESN